jgi:ADP-ribose pyrophosphatase YjhB (NUDIX family)
LSHCHTVRVTGVLIHGGKILLVQQALESRPWSLPGGKLEPGETIAEGMIREMREETGLEVRLVRQLYVCDKPEDCIIHMTFLLETDSIEGLRPPTNELETTPITGIAFVAPGDLRQYGFSDVWAANVASGFPDAPRYAGLKANVGL